MADVEAGAAVVRAVALLVPAAVAGALALWRRPDRRLGAGILLAVAWNAPTLLAVNVVAQDLGWWRFPAAPATAAGIPVDVLLGWIVLWGAVPLLAFPRGLVVPVTLLGLADLALMPLGEPVVDLGPTWLVGEAVAIGVALLPGILLGRWTQRRHHLGRRVLMQVGIAGALMLWVLPLLALDASWGLAEIVRDRPGPIVVLALAALAVAALLGVAAVQELGERGGGTPVPYDPPERLVRSGPYAYMANPMQASITIMLAVTAAVSGEVRLLLATVVALAYGTGLAAWHEETELAARFGAAWTAYRRSTRGWWPSWRPALLPAPATLWIGGTCEICAPVARFFAARGGISLHVRAAEWHPHALRRITYEAGGQRWEGVAAFARGLEHLHLGWAVLGWALRLPLVVHAVQLLVDAAGGGPRSLPARGRPQAPAQGGLGDRT